MNKTAVITGAGSGVGRAAAVRLATQGWSIGLIGRTAASLADTAEQARQATRPSAAGEPRFVMSACDVANPADVERAAREILATFGTVHALVNSAGINVPARGLDVLSVDDFHRVIDVNLSGAFHCVHAFLPAMRKQREGTIVNIVSDAGVYPNTKAGGAYVASKFALSGLTQSINLEERPHGVRACAIFPGDINTPLLDKRPVPPPAEARLRMLQPEDIADCVMLAINLPPRAVVEQMLVRPG